MNNKPEDKITSKESTAVEKEKRIENMKKIYSDPDNFLPENKKLSEYYDLQILKSKLTPAQEKKRDEVGEEIVTMYGLDNGIWSANLSYGKHYAPLAHMRHKIIKDYGCKSSLELMLADRIVAHYWRAMRTDRIINQISEQENNGFTFNQQKVNILKQLYRGVELADRQLSADIMLLKELKQPRLNIKVNTENAYIAQNQQVVNTDKNEPGSITEKPLEANDLGK
ncbi:hypothetical protein KGQ27_03415 [Patescibacteria group bacterium]|nr:hypothetical protein [Patescibacteria group bacterium]MDE1946902.1 hypothetical protein [Patescibacteria group bacterium]MDE2011103.1 hypothetical protein [Patescibacteria group bacterium]